MSSKELEEANAFLREMVEKQEKATEEIIKAATDFHLARCEYRNTEHELSCLDMWMRNFLEVFGDHLHYNQMKKEKYHGFN